MKRLTFDVLLAGTLAIAPLAWGQDYGSSGSMQNRNDTTPSAPKGTTPDPQRRNRPPYPGDDPNAPPPSDLPPTGVPTPSSPPGAPTPPSTTTGSERSGNIPP